MLEKCINVVKNENKNIQAVEHPQDTETDLINVQIWPTE